MNSHYLLFHAPSSFSGSFRFALFEKGPSLVVLDSNFQNRQEIGRYEWELPPDVFPKVHAERVKAKLGDVPSSPSVQPDERTVTFGETLDGGKTYDMKAFTLKEFTPAVSALADLFMKEALPVLDHPKRALRGATVQAPQDVKTGMPFEATVSLTNVGTEPAEFDNPLCNTDKAGWTGVRLHVRADKPLDKVEESEAIQVDLSPELIRPFPSGASRPPGKRLKLKPGEVVQFTVRKWLKLTPGRCVAVLTVMSGERLSEPLAVGGALTMALGTFNAVAGP